MALALAAAALAHVPRFGPFLDNCAHAHEHNVSQIVYFKGSGGVEFHQKSATEPVNTITGELIHFDVLFRDKVDASTFALYVGCGGCRKADPLTAPMMYNVSFQEPAVEFFTQTRVRSIVPEEYRTFDSRQLNPSVCTEEHFTILLEDYGNRSDGPIVWSAVLGDKEAWTWQELAAFPVYILGTHGDGWTDMWYTFPLMLFIGAPLVVLAWRGMGRSAGWRVLDSSPLQVKLRGGGLMPLVSLRFVDARESLYDLSIHVFIACALEQMLHLVVAQVGAGISSAFWVGVLIILATQVLPAAFVAFVWSTMLYSRDIALQADTIMVSPGSHDFLMICANAWWGIPELLLAVGLGTVAFGSGFYIAPVAIAVAALVRLGEIAQPVVNTSAIVPYGPVEPAAPKAPAAPVAPANEKSAVPDMSRVAV